MTLNGALAAKYNALAADHAKSREELDRVNKALKAPDAEKADSSDLLTRLYHLQADSDRKTEKLAKYEDMLGTAEGKEAASLYRRYQWNWYLAVAGWGVAVLLALGLLAALSLRPPGPAGSATGEAPEEAPPHRIT